MLGNLNEGWENTLKTLLIVRLGDVAEAVGNAQSALEDALSFSKKRIQFGQPLYKFQAIQHLLADMQVDVEIARLLLYKLAWMIDRGIHCAKESSIIKLFSTEAFNRVVNKGIQIMGGYGCLKEYDMERYLRDCKLWEIGGGTSEIQRNIIAKEMGL